MALHQKILTAVLLLLTGVLLGIVLMVSRGSWISPERVEVRYTDVVRSSEPIEPAPGEEDYSPSYIFRDIARDIVPAVVYIETDVAVDRAMPDDEHHEFEEQFWERFLPRRRAQSIGSGVMISPDGYILTNHHVVDGADDRIRVMTHDKKEHRAKLVGGDPSTDLAVIKIDTDNANALVIGNSDNVEVGDWVMAVGNPFRLRSTVTAGIVSAKGRDVDIISDRMRIESFIQTDAAINRGNSGGALVNTRGELIGINTAIASESGSYQGYGFAVPINMAMKIGQDIIEFGEVQRAYLGVEIASVDQSLADRLDLQKIAGVEIRNLVSGGSADLGGLKQGDVVLQINGYPVDEANRLQERVALMRPGDHISMQVWRDKQTKDVEFELMGQDNEAIREWTSAAPQMRNELEFSPNEEPGISEEKFNSGFSVADLAKPEDLSQDEVVVIRVLEGSIADTAGLLEEDVIIALNDNDVRNTKTFASKWRSMEEEGATASLRILRGEDKMTIHVDTSRDHLP